MTTTDDVSPPSAEIGGRWLSPGVLGVGGASLFSDAGHEMATGLLPTFLTSTLHSGPAALGAIEGASDALIGLAKLAGGPLSNDPARRGRIASGGYLGTAVATAAIGLTTAVWQVGILRAVAWASRGIRSPARDTLLVSLVPRSAYGRASGLERAGDNAGALIGPLLAAGLVSLLGVRHTILLAIIPGLLAAVAITVAARQARATITSPVGRRTLSFNLRELWHAGVPRLFVPVACFEFGNLATTLLILRATDLLHTGSAAGRSLTAATSLAIVLYAVHNGVAAATSVGAGHLVDRIGPSVVFAGGAGVYVAAYLVFAWDQHAWPVLLLGFALAGVGIGCAETAESSTVALHLPDRLRGNGYGVLGLTQSVGDLGATLVAGVLWATVSPTAAFVYAAGWMALSVAGSRLITPHPDDVGLADTPH